MKNNLFQGLEETLQDLKRAFLDLQSCLDQERAAIVGWDLKAIVGTTTAKQSVLTHIHQLIGKQKLFYKRLNIPFGGFAPEALMREALEQDEPDRGHRICLLRDEVKVLGEVLYQFNEEQSRYIAHSLSSIQSSLTFISSASGQYNHGAYTPQGVTQEFVKKPTPAKVDYAR